MGEILIDEPDLIIEDPAGDCVDYWTALVKEDKTNNNILQTEQIVQVDLFEKNTGHKKLPKEKKGDLRKKIKNNLRNSTFPPEQIRKAIEGYAQDPTLMDMRIDQVDPSSIFLYDVCSENFLTASELERKGLLQPIEDVEFDWKTFQDFKEMNLLSKHQDDFEPGEIEDDEEEAAFRRKSCRTERYESPVRSKGRQESAKSSYRDRRQDDQTKENEREKDRDRDRERERRNSPEKKRLVKLKDQKDDTKDCGQEMKRGVNQEEIHRKERKSSQENRQIEKYNNRRTSTEDRDKEQSREKERDRSRERMIRKRSNSQERRRENYAPKRDEDGYRQELRFGRKDQNQGFTRGYKPLRPYDNQAQRYRQDDRENGNQKNGYQGRMNRNYGENQKNPIINVDEKEPRDNKVTVIEDRQEPSNSFKYGNYQNGRPRQFDPDRRENYQQQENSFNHHQSQPKPNDMGQTILQMVAQMVVNQISTNPNIMGQFMNGGGGYNGNRGTGGYPNRYQQKPCFNNNYRRYQNNYNNGFQRKPYYSRDNENDRRKRSNSNEREKRNDSRNRYDNNNNEGVTEVTRRRNF